MVVLCVEGKSTGLLVLLLKRGLVVLVVAVVVVVQPAPVRKTRFAAPTASNGWDAKMGCPIPLCNVDIDCPGEHCCERHDNKCGNQYLPKHFNFHIQVQR